MGTPMAEWDWAARLTDAVHKIDIVALRSYARSYELGMVRETPIDGNGDCKMCALAAMGASEGFGYLTMVRRYGGYPHTTIREMIDAVVPPEQVPPGDVVEEIFERWGDDFGVNFPADPPRAIYEACVSEIVARHLTEEG